MDEADQRTLLEAGTGDEVDTSWGTGAAAESWGYVSMEEVLRTWLIKILRDELVLPGSTASKIGLKPSLDGASVRGAAKGKKQWTTMILQFLCLGVDSDWWGQDAVIHMLERAQSYHNIARVRVWQGKDDKSNVCPAPPNPPWIIRRTSSAWG